MRVHDGWLSSQRVWLLLMASTASALSLANIQPLHYTTLPLSCVLAYNSPVFGCVMEDFSYGTTCSPNCLQGLAKIQYIIQSVCSSVDVSPTGVLGRALSGTLISILCEGTFPDGPTTTTSRSSTAALTTSIARTSIRSTLIFTTVRPTSTTSTAATETEKSSTSTSDPSSTSTSEAQDLTSDVQVPTSVQSPLPTIEASAPTSSAVAPEPTPDGGDSNSSGGGSPFDIVRSGSKQLTASWTKAAFVALGLGLVLMR